MRRVWQSIQGKKGLAAAFSARRDCVYSFGGKKGLDTGLVWDKDRVTGNGLTHVKQIKPVEKRLANQHAMVCVSESTCGRC
jgi:hypothetical protein